MVFLFHGLKSNFWWRFGKFAVAALEKLISLLCDIVWRDVLSRYDAFCLRAGTRPVEDTSKGSQANGVSLARLKYNFCWSRMAVSTSVASVMVFHTNASFGWFGLLTGALIIEMPLDIVDLILGSRAKISFVC